MASSPTTSPASQRRNSSSMMIQRSNSIEESSSISSSNNNNNNIPITRYERTNTADSSEVDDNILLSPSNSKEEDFDSDNEEEEVENIINISSRARVESSDSGLLMEALAPGECSSPIHTTATTGSNNNKNGRFDLCGSMYKRRGGFGRNAENNWYVIICSLCRLCFVLSA